MDILPIIALLSGFILLIWSADVFTDNGAKIAYIFKVSPLIIGLVIFGFGTSAPEILISALAAFEGNTTLSIGNAIGSNILNIALVLGVSAVIFPIKVSGGTLKKEWLFLFLATIVAGLVMLDYHLGWVDGLILLVLLVGFLSYAWRQSQNQGYDEFAELSKKFDKNHTAKTWVMLIIGLLVLVGSAKLVVFGGVEVAKTLGVSDLVIGLTIIALGTSLPELAVSIASVVKKQHAMVVGNIIGSNLFNTLAVLAIPGLIHPSNIPHEVMTRDYPLMLGLTILLFLVAYKFKKSVISRLEGVVLLAIFGYYMTRLF